MRSVAGIVLLLTAYGLVYFRLMVRHHYQKATGKNESTFGVLFSLPPYSKVPAEGKKYVLRYWGAVAVMVACIAYLAATGHFAAG